MEWWLKHPDGKRRAKGKRTEAYMRDALDKVLGMDKFAGLDLEVRWWGEDAAIPEQTQSTHGANDVNGRMGEGMEAATNVIGCCNVEKRCPKHEGVAGEWCTGASRINS
jgi:hypothetical protein